MPQVNFKSVYAASSEDSNYPASNLLSNTLPGKKWKVDTNIKDPAYVILQLEKPEKIVGIDIGNEQSAFIEVVVGKTTNLNAEFKPLLLSSSFMTMLDTRNLVNTNRVRCFQSSLLCEDTRNDKWDLVKIICYQPFNTQIKYGLAFVRVYVDDKITEQSVVKGSSSTLNTSITNTKFESSQIGKYKFRQSISDSDSDNSDTAFSRWKKNKNQNEHLSTASAIRAASNANKILKPSMPTFNKKKNSPNISKTKDRNDSILYLDRNRLDLCYEKEDEMPNERLERIITADRDKVKAEKESNAKMQPLNVNNMKDISAVNEKKRRSETSSEPSAKKPKPYSDNIREQNSSKKSKQAELYNKSKSSSVQEKTSECTKEKNSIQIIYKSFHELFHGVVIVLSGLQNPDRGILRSKAIEMGAKYKADWDDTCTHLICAFKNTPKYNQVKGKGKIITRKWIEDCYRIKKRLSWRKYALNKDDCDKSDSEPEFCDISLKPVVDSTRKNESKCDVESSIEESIQNKEEASESDTEDEIDRARETIAKQSKTECNIYEVSTDEELPNENQPQRIKGDSGFFKNQTFYLSPDIDSNEAKHLFNIISKYKGTILTENATNTKYVICKTKLTCFGQMVNPQWIYECDDLECFLSATAFNV